jgi:hypothetical protein
VLAATQAIEDDRTRAHTLDRLIPLLPTTLFPEALATAGTIPDAWSRIILLDPLIPHLPPSQQLEVLQEALAAVGAIPDAWARTISLARLVPHLPGEQQLEVLQEALNATCAIQDGWVCAGAFKGLFPLLPPTLLPEALTAAAAIQHDGARGRTLESLAPSLTRWTEDNSEMPYHAWCITLRTLVSHPHPAFLVDLAALLPFALALAGDDAPEVAAGIFHAIQEVCAWWP